MHICYEWLRNYVEIKKSAEELAMDLTLFGHEVEDVQKVGKYTVLDFEITPNRGDCLSIFGMAREVSALYDTDTKKDEVNIKEEDLKKNISVKIVDKMSCPRYTARIIDNIKVGETPQQIKDYLTTYGFRCLNNIVDITNYVMLITGQPLHAFDYDKINDGVMNIRLSKSGEEVMTLDGKNHILDDDTIIISDDEKIYDLAGVMGGIKSEVDESTKTIILQGAVFDPKLIRRSSKYLNHITDASYRYERGIDYNGTVYSVDLAANLIKETCSSAKIGELIDIKSEEYKTTEIELDISKVNKLIGIDIDTNIAKKYLEKLGFTLKENIVIVPSYRYHDVKIWQDLAEEIARVYGYNKIHKNEMTPVLTNLNIDSDWYKRETIKVVLKEIGLTEVYSYSFADKDKLEMLGFNLKDCVETANPISPELKYLRPSLLPSLLSQISKNPWAPEINIFEIEKVFEKDAFSDAEKWQLGIATVGKPEKLVSSALQSLELQVKIENADQKILDAYKIRRPVKFFICDVDKINTNEKELENKISDSKFRPISKFPPTIRDLAFIVNSKVDSSDVALEIKKISESILLVELFDEFLSDKFGKDSKNIAYHVWIQNMSDPVSEKESQKIVGKIIQIVENKFQAKLRR